MPLDIAYSSGEEDDAVAKDAFGLASLPTLKKPRTDHPTPMNTDAAPHVLSEVNSTCLHGILAVIHRVVLGSP